MNSKYYLIFLLFLLVAAGSVVAQTGTITGTVTEQDGTEPLQGATVRLMQDSAMVGGAYTGEDGTFKIQAKPGTYSLIFTYISYESKTVEGVTIAAGETVTQDQSMGLDVEDTGDENTVVIMDKVIKNTEAVLINIRRKSTSVVDVISLDQVRRAGDSDAGGAMKRVTGVTVEGGKYVYVRGLGDRYSKTLLNGSEIPGLDPDRNSVQMDMFPSNLLDNLVVHKTFSPNLPGSFTGGLVKIATKDFPPTFTMQYRSSFGVNTQASFRNDFITGQRGGLEWIGMDDGTRALPDLLANRNFIIPSIGEAFTDPVASANLDAASKAFATPIYPENTNSTLNHSHAFSIGDQKTLFGKPFGYLASLSYRNNQKFYEDAMEGRFKLVGQNSTDLNTESFYNGQTAIREVLWGGLVNLSWLPGLNHQLRFNYMHNQSGTSSAFYFEGPIPKDDQNLIFQTRSTAYRERAMDAFQLRGDHTFGNLTIDWVGAFILSSQDEPDLRFFSNDFTRSDTVYDIQTNLYNAPSRYFRNMNEVNLDGKVNGTFKFLQWNDLESNLRFGGGYTFKDREFFERRFEFVNNSPSTVIYNGSEEEFWQPENVGLIGQNANGVFLYGNYVRDATEDRNSYLGTQNIIASYAMVELPITQKLRTVAGARLETTDMLVQSFDALQTDGVLDNTDILPAVDIIYSPRTNVINNLINIRGGYSRTLARPVFRELAPFASFDFVGDVILVGNPELQRSLIDNVDLRFELFPTTRELISVGVFYKSFQDPIERVLIPGSNGQVTWKNVDEATVYGVEFEFRKSLGFVTDALKDFRASGNVSLISSQVNIDPAVYQLILDEDPTRQPTRQMYSQSPYTINAELAYINDSLGLTSSLNFNVFGPRISFVTDTGTPNVFEQPRPSLDFSIAKTVGKVLSFRLRARNIFNPLYNHIHTFQGVEYTFRSYRVGRTFSLGITVNLDGQR